MKELIALPVILALVVGVATQLEDIAKSSSDKAISFSDDMNTAMDCATRGIPIRECSPSLMDDSYDFTEERESFTAALEELKEGINQTNITEAY